MSTKYVDETCRQKSFRPNYVDKMSSTKYAVDLSAVDEVSIDKMPVDKVLSKKYLSTNDMQFRKDCKRIYVGLRRRRRKRLPRWTLRAAAAADKSIG